MSGKAVRVEVAKVAPLLTCPLCNKLFREATTIKLCLHTFCKECIYKMIKDEGHNTCPVCNKKLGKSPLAKLRDDHSLRNLRTKIFGSTEKVESKAVQAAPSVQREEISRSSRVSRRRFSPIWFSLEASNDKDKDSVLPQIPSHYLRVQDGNLPVASIKKYVAQKLGLPDEEVVEMELLGKRLDSTMQLQDMVEWWLRTYPPMAGKLEIKAGSSAEECVMVLHYSRKSSSQSS